jgi:SAM-dependent methyltransferase
MALDASEMALIAIPVGPVMQWGVRKVQRRPGWQDGECPRRIDLEQQMAAAYRENVWHGRESRSGEGSDLVYTRKLIQDLPILFRMLGIRSILDIPCGDFNWMRKADLAGLNYTGADIVDELILKNATAYAKGKIRFCTLDLLSDPLPKADLILCRDCLVHFSYADIRRAFQNFAASGSKYLLMTTFVNRTSNADLATGTNWRPLNFEQEPFLLPPPLTVINEELSEADGAYSDKSLALWEIEILRDQVREAAHDGTGRLEAILNAPQRISQALLQHHRRSVQARTVFNWLIRCADPLQPTRAWPRRPLSLETARDLVDQALRHGVLYSLLRHFPPFESDRFFGAIKEQARARHRASRGWALTLRGHGEAIMAEAKGLPVTVVKGPMFARVLYPDPAFRSFTDIDLLAAPQALPQLNAILEREGFFLAQCSPASAPQEWTWLHCDNQMLMIEVQTDLVHAPSLRGAFSLSYETIADGAETPAALLLIALVHGALGQHYTQLQHIVDICQAARALKGAAEERRFETLVDRANARFVAVVGLNLAGRLFAEPRCRELARALGPVRHGRLAKLLIGRSVVRSAHTENRWLHSWRRQAFRKLSKRPRK